MKLRRRRRLAHGALAGVVLMCAVLVSYPPGRFGFYPRCPAWELLHLQCPGCGATRALAALLHGRVMEAIRLNALFCALLPFGLAGAVVSYWRAVRMGEFRWPEVPAGGVYAVLGIAAAFMLVRNLPV